MAMSANDLQVIEALLASANAGDIGIAMLRLQFPHLSWSQCDAADVTEPPFRVFQNFDIHLLNTADHCARLTAELETATGIILARHVLS